MKIYAAFCLIFLLYSGLAHSTWSDSIQDGWDKSKQYSTEAWDRTKNAWDSTNAMFSESEEDRKQARLDQEDERFRQMWGNVFSQLEEGLKVVDEIKVAPESAIFREDKKSLRSDLNKILDKTMVLLEDESINDYRDKIDELNQLISQANNNILKYREEKITAPRTHVVKTTKEGYDKKIADEALNIADYKAESEKIKIHLKDRLNDIGVNLTLEQVNILLTRVDANDIIQMSVIFDVLKKITMQLTRLTQDSGEEIIYAKKYYGMHLVLLELVNYMQQKYIEIVDSVYLPGIDAIIKKTVNIQNNSIKQMSEDTSPQRIAIYKANIAAQELTLKTANLYKANLEGQKNQVAFAQKALQKDLILSQNTYDTVEVSADLLSVLKTSNDSFDALMSLQVPQIVPFENIEMQNKYQELSQLLKQ